MQLYKLGRAGYWRLLLDVDNLRSIGRAYRTASALNRLDRERVQQHERTLDALASERAGARSARREDARKLCRSRRSPRAAAIDRAVAARTALVASIDARRDLNAQLTGELEAAQQRLQGTVAQLGGRGASAVCCRSRPFRGALPWPAQGVVTGRFGRQTSSRFGTSIARNGIEISLAEGSRCAPFTREPWRLPTSSPATATWSSSTTATAPTRCMAICRRSRSARGAHRGRPGAASGPRAADPSGNPALYFELRIDGKPVDPLQWLKR